MTIQILILQTSGTTTMLGLLFVLVVVLLLLVVCVRYLSRIGKQRQKFRQELDQLADELDKVRKQAEEHKKDESSTKSR
ncbi:MAG: hypothetical protein ACYS4W_08315 [Planctomycetota bacterium]|jgi:uncharacterized membrane-anchored protein YhcB (DUF1043 family)